MMTDKPSRLVPKLRFPEFRETVEWDTKPIFKLAYISKGVQLNRNTIIEGSFPVWNGGVTPSGFHNEWNTEGETITISEGGTCGFVNFCNQRFWLGGHCYALKNLSSEVKGTFLFQSLKSSETEIMRLRVGSGLPNIQRHELERFPVVFPHPAEQQKIADCLGSLDGLIAAEDRKLDALRRHKRGLMQQLFPRPGETVPPLGGQSDWKTHDLSKVTFFQEGPGIMAADFYSTGIPLVRLSGLAEESVTLDGCNFLDSHKVAQKWAHFRLAVDDLVISTSASFGRVSIVTETTAGAVFYTGLVRFRSTDKRLSNAYLKAYLESPDFLRQVESHAVGGGIKHFGPTHLRQMQIQIPPLFEQQRIADCLGSLDGLIAAQGRKLNALRRHKQGLMQQLFPSLEDR